MMIRDCVTCVYFVESRVHSFSLSTLCGCWVVLLHINSLCDVGCYRNLIRNLHFCDAKVVNGAVPRTVQC